MSVALLELLRQADNDPWRESVRQALQADDFDTLLRLAAEADVTAQPPTALQFVAEALFHGKYYAETIGMLQRAQRQYPNDRWINNDLATAFHHSLEPRLEEAVRYYTAALAISRSAVTHVKLGMALMSLERNDEAAQQFQAALELVPDYPDGHFNLGALHFNAGRLEEAAAKFGDALAGEPDSAHFHFWLGSTRLRQKDYTRAAAALQQSVKLDDGYAPAQVHLAEALGHQGRYAEAVTHYERAFESLDLSGRMYRDYRPPYYWHAARAAGILLHQTGPSAAAERNRNRARALAWLRVEMAYFEEVMKNGDSHAKQRILRTLDNCRHDPVFALIRAPAALANMPEAERADCQRLWEEVDALLMQLRRSP